MKTIEIIVHGKHYGQFPSFATHQIAAATRCRACAGPLVASEAVDKGYPKGRGQYGLKCRQCSATLYYDIKEQTATA